MKKTLADPLTRKKKYHHKKKKNQRLLKRFPFFFFSIIAFVLAVFLSFNLSSESSAQASSGHIRMVRELETDELGIQNPAGIAFSEHANVFHVMDSDSPSTPPFGYSDFVMITAVEERIGSAHIAATIADPKNTAFDDKYNRLLIFQTNANKLISIDATTDGGLDANSLVRYDTRHFDLQDPQGMAVDPASGQVLILDSAGHKIIRIQPTKDGSFEAAVISQLALQFNSSAGLQGLAYDPTNDHFFVMNPAAQALYEINREGDLVSSRDLSSFNFSNPQAMVFAPSGDPTDDPAILSLYLVDATTTFEYSSNLTAIESELQVQAAKEPAGRIVELSLVPLPQLTAAVPTYSVTLIKTTDTSQFQTPDDPTDDSIEYWPDVPYLGTGTDSFTYQICDADSDCAIATVNITVNPVTLATVTDTSLLLVPNAGLGSPSAVDDDATVVENSWVNIDVLANDDFGPDGHGTGPINIFPTCALCTGPSYGTARVNEGPRSPDPSGLTYLRDHPTTDYTDKLLISDGEVNELSPPNPAAYTGYNLLLTTLSGSLTSTLTTYNPPSVTFSQEPTGVAYNPANDHLFFTNDNAKVINDLDPGSDGLYNTSDDFINNISTSAFGSTDPEGITFDSTRGNGHLILVDGLGAEVYDIDLGSNGTLNQSDSVTHFDVTSMGIRDPEGIVFSEDTGSLYILSSKGVGALIAVTTIDGTLLRYLDISATNSLNPAGLVFAPPSAGGPNKNLYIVDRGVDNNDNSMENDGKMYEVSIPNSPPTVDAGLPQMITLPDSATLDGTVNDDGLPNPPGSVTTSWSKFSGPGQVTFDDASAVDTTAHFSTPGDYILRLSANDGALSDNDIVSITVNPALIVNQPPTVNAGPDQTITLPSFASLDGTVSDDGLPNPPGEVTTSWNKISGPGPVTFTDPNSVDITARFTIAGNYVLRLTAIDGSLSNYDEVTITVNPTPEYNVNIWLPVILSVNNIP